VERNVEREFIFFHQFVNGFELRRFSPGANLSIIKNSLFSKFAGRMLVAGFLAAIAAATSSDRIYPNPAQWNWEWPKTDFNKKSLDFGEILSGGVPKDGIRSIGNLEFMYIKEAESFPRTMPVLSFELNREAKAYPLGILTRAEIVNDRVAGSKFRHGYARYQPGQRCGQCGCAAQDRPRADGRGPRCDFRVCFPSFPAQGDTTPHQVGGAVTVVLLPGRR
jgi:hypothetical protein